MPELAQSLTNSLSKKVTKINASGIRSFDDEISSIEGIIKLTLGEPDMNTPEHVKQAAVKSIQNNDSHYSPNLGKLELRRVVSNYLKNKIGVEYDSKTEIAITVGATEAISAALNGISNPGDKVIIPTPVFSLYWPVTALADAEAVLVDTSHDNFILTAEHLEQVIQKEGSAVKALVLNYPTNPTGVEYSKEEIIALAEVARKYNLFVITDEIYSDLIYGVKHYSIANFIPERTIYISGLSKSHAMTGYRLGYIAGPQEAMKQIGKVHAFMVTCVNDASQAAAIEALTEGLEDTEKFRQIYAHRRDFVYQALKEMDLELINPQGAFYIFVKIPKKYGKDDLQFALDLAKKGRVGVIPGHVFGPGGAGYVRISYAASDENLNEAMKRMREFLNEESK
ncbi:aminotransferase class I/II-fold pyridoxal phosphate-dependent enzyme [Lactobacillus sp.]|uniref:aminotransferase class I/II-fold pyridoxal phosphate-dependent enzyme n=1 Tax=Lactobacillus sp. TaxID=1591 RepID=UPI00198FEBEA|nr:aminotransferase class I/II-fold pyridoxal phosphate-dependent enzyme [Lactobacillus sp.]MBD5429521.1 aminotransferase class I/II-fold pyridoxal phosphate-dependent enzyme [Lactobacillus sp.]